MNLTDFLSRKTQKKTEPFSLDYQDWQSLQIGQEVHAKVHFGNQIELIFDDQ